jgi:hypothetical protein
MECICHNFNEVSGAEVFEETARKARKRHRCCECGNIINPGQFCQQPHG